MAPKWIFFDVGWTLEDETRGHLDRFEAVLAAAPGASGLTARELFHRYEGAVTARAVDPVVTVLESVGLAAGDRPRFPFSHDHARLYRDALPALRALHGSAHLGVLANQSAGVGARLGGWGAAQFFDLVLGSTEAGFAKPDPRFFAAATERAGCPPGDIVMVGDRLDNDIAPAKAAGWGTVWVRRGLHAGTEPRGAAEQPDHVVTNLAKCATLWVAPERLRVAEHLDADGAIVAWPDTDADKRLVLAYLASRFEPGRNYTEREVGAVIDDHHRFGDIALLRRELVDRKLMQRDDFGRAYRRIEPA